MKVENTHQKGKYYLRGLLLDRSESKDVAHNYLVGNFSCETFNVNELNGVSCYHYNYESSVKPPAYLTNRFSTSENEHFVHHVFGLDVKLSDSIKAFFVAAPNKEVLETIRPTPSQTKYVKCDLLKICSDQFTNPSHKEIKVSRLNARLVGDFGNAVSSIAFYGKDVVSSQIIQEILGIQKFSAESKIHDPFLNEDSRRERSQLLAQERFIDPKSCRLTWDNGKEKAVSLNVDRFGNFSLYCLNEDTFAGVDKIFNYLDSINAFIVNMAIDPLKRSERALNIVTI